MKISIFSAFYPFRGGIAQFNAKLFRELEKDHEVCAFTFKKQYPDFLFPGKSQFVDDNEKVDKIPAKRIVSTFNPFTYFNAAKKIRQANPDVFISNYWMSLFGFFTGIMASGQSKQTTKIALIHNLIPHEPRFFDKWLNSFFLKRYDGFIVMSEAVKIDLIKSKSDAKFIQLEHPWYDHFGELIEQSEARNELKILQNKKTLLFFGLIRDYKGLDLLINAFSRLNDEFQLVIAGEVYGNPEKYENQIANSPSKERIFFFNRYIPDNEVKFYFSASDVCILPYRSATQSGITATSFHFEIPVIATKVGGLEETVKDNVNGLIVDQPDAELIKSAIQKYFMDGTKEKFQHTLRMEKSGNSWKQFAESLVLFTKSLKK